MIKDVKSHLLPIEGACNVRDIGNYETRDGHLTKEGVFYRADNTAGFTQRDIAFFTGRGLSLVIDLRSGDEVGLQPSVFAEVPSVHYENVQIIDGIHSHFVKSTSPSGMGELYIQFLESAKSCFGTIFKLFAAAPGPVLYHCTAGKDRTGVVTMLLLALVGVSDEDIVEDYAATDIFTAHVLESQKAQLAARGLDVPEFMLKAAPENMRETLLHLHTVYGSAEKYLLDCNVSEEELRTIRNRFV